MNDKQFQVALANGATLDLRNQNMGEGNKQVEDYLKEQRGKNNENENV